MLETVCLDKNGNTVEYLTQWDINQKLIADLSGFDLSLNPDVHFYNDSCQNAYVVKSTVSGNIITASIPNILLQEALPLHAYIFLADSDDTSSRKTVVYIRIPIKKKLKPYDYVYTEDDTIFYDEKLTELEGKITAIEEQVEKDKISILNLNSNMSNIYSIGAYRDYSDGVVNLQNPFLFHYADGTTSKDAYEAGQTHVTWRGRVFSIGEDGVLSTVAGGVPNENIYYDRLNCGYKIYTSVDPSDGTETKRIHLFDSDAKPIVGLVYGGYRQQGCLLYDDNGLVGFVTNLTTDTSTGTISYTLFDEFLKKSDVTNVAEVGA